MAQAIHTKRSQMFLLVFLSKKLLPWTSGSDNSPITHLSEAISSALDEVLVTPIAAGDQEEAAVPLLS